MIEGNPSRNYNLTSTNPDFPSKIQPLEDDLEEINPMMTQFETLGNFTEKSSKFHIISK